MKTVYIVLDVDKYGMPQVVQVHYVEGEAASQVAALKYLDHEHATYEIVDIKVDEETVN